MRVIGLFLTYNLFPLYICHLANCISKTRSPAHSNHQGKPSLEDFQHDATLIASKEWPIVAIGAQDTSYKPVWLGFQLRNESSRLLDDRRPHFNTPFMPALRRICATVLYSTITVLAASGADLHVPEHILFERGIEYANPDNQHLQLNIARPKHADHLLPCVLCIHGGGFRAGNRDSYDPLLIKFADR